MKTIPIGRRVKVTYSGDDLLDGEGIDGHVDTGTVHKIWPNGPYIYEIKLTDPTQSPDGFAFAREDEVEEMEVH